MRALNKRGAEERSFLIWLIVAIVVALIAVLGFSGGFQKFINLLKGTPSDLAVIAEACSNAATYDLKAEYCSNFREVDIGGNKRYISCQYSGLQSLIKDDRLKGDKCGKATGEISWEKWYCDNLKASQGSLFKPGVNVNDKPCSEWLK